MKVYISIAIYIYNYALKKTMKQLTKYCLCTTYLLTEKQAISSFLQQKAFFLTCSQEINIINVSLLFYLINSLYH